MHSCPVTVLFTRYSQEAFCLHSDNNTGRLWGSLALRGKMNDPELFQQRRCLWVLRCHRSQFCARSTWRFTSGRMKAQQDTKGEECSHRALGWHVQCTGCKKSVAATTVQLNTQWQVVRKQFNDSYLCCYLLLLQPSVEAIAPCL